MGNRSFLIALLVLSILFVATATGMAWHGVVFLLLAIPLNMALLAAGGVVLGGPFWFISGMINGQGDAAGFRLFTVWGAAGFLLLALVIISYLEPWNRRMLAAETGPEVVPALQEVRPAVPPPDAGQSPPPQQVAVAEKPAPPTPRPRGVVPDETSPVAGAAPQSNAKEPPAATPEVVKKERHPSPQTTTQVAAPAPPAPKPAPVPEPVPAAAAEPVPAPAPEPAPVAEPAPAPESAPVAAPSPDDGAEPAARAAPAPATAAKAPPVDADPVDVTEAAPVLDGDGLETEPVPTEDGAPAEDGTPAEDPAGEE